MKKNKFIDLLKKLSQTELKSLQKFVDSSYFNLDANCSKLLALTIPFHPEYSNQNINKELLFNQLFDQKEYDDKKMRYLFSNTAKLIESFLIQQELNRSPIQKNTFLLQALNSRKSDKYFAQHLKKEYETINQQKTRDRTHYDSLLQLREEEGKFNAANNNRHLDDSLQQLVYDLEIQSLSKKLRYYCELVNRQNVLAKSYDLQFMDANIKLAQHGFFKDVPIVSIYYQILMTLTEGENEHHYYQLKGLIENNLALFPQPELRDMYAFAQNYCIKQINNGKENFLRELFNIYQILLEQEIIFDNGELAHFDFKNIITVAIRLQELHWVDNFITHYQARLNPKLKENSVNFNKAKLCYTRKEFKQSRKLLLTTEFTDVYYHLDAKILLLKTYYDLGDIEPLLSLLETVKVYLRRNKLVSDYQRITYLTFLRFLKILVKLQLGSPISAEATLEKLKNTTQVADSTWLREKLEEWVN